MSSSSSSPKLDISQLFGLHGKTAIVTGGTGGLGTAMTAALASAGADIVSIELPNDPNSSRTAQVVKDCGQSYCKYECDMRDTKQIRSTYQRMWADGVTADIVLNCAGVQRRAEAVDFTDEDIELVLDVNVKATLVSCQEFAKKLLAEGQPGKIINIASIISFIGGKNILPYAASKGGVLQLTKALSNEWAEKGIQCNCIHPGYFRTPMTEQYSTDPKYEKFNEYVMGRVPAKRWGDPRDLSGAIIFLASPASDYMSGTSIVVDGGFMGM
jgi:2-dehydro-3-deoxy-D-gluconate 5-dehydrogenase